MFGFDKGLGALLPETSIEDINDQGLLVARGERGICRVVCFSERHDLALASMTQPQIRAVVDTWTEQYRELAGMPWVNYVQIFENRGAMMGASNPHPHCQIWANASLSNQAEKEQVSQREYYRQHGSCLLCDYLALGVDRAVRFLCPNQDFVVLVPFWAMWPVE